MAGLTREGFTPDTYDAIKERISNRLEILSPGIDLSPEVPDGHLLEIFSFELALAYTELGLVYDSYNPALAVGAGLRNLGLITGLPYGAATRSQADIDLVGTAGTIVPKDSVVSDADGNEFYTQLDARIPSSVEVVAEVSGAISVPASTIINIITPVAGWASIDQPADGRKGGTAQTETAYRNLRNRTVMRNYVSVSETISARMFEALGIEQVVVINNDSAVIAPDGTPIQTIHVTVGEIDAAITDAEIAQVILNTKGLGCPTFGTTTVAGVLDVQGEAHEIKFTRAAAKQIHVNLEVTYLTQDSAGATEGIREDLKNHINGLLANEDVIWSRLFEYITPYAKAQIDLLELSTDGITYTAANVLMGASEYASTIDGQINITVN